MIERRISRNRRIVDHHKGTGDNRADRLGNPILIKDRTALSFMPVWVDLQRNAKIERMTFIYEKNRNHHG